MCADADFEYTEPVLLFTCAQRVGQFASVSKSWLGTPCAASLDACSAVPGFHARCARACTPVNCLLFACLQVGGSWGERQNLGGLAIYYRGNGILLLSSAVHTLLTSAACPHL